MVKSNIEVMVAMNGVYRTHGTACAKLKPMAASAASAASAAPAKRRRKCKTSKGGAYRDVHSVSRSIVKKGPKSSLSSCLKSALKSKLKGALKEDENMTFRTSSRSNATNDCKPVATFRIAGGSELARAKANKSKPRGKLNTARNNVGKVSFGKVVSSGYGPPTSAKIAPLKSILRRSTALCDLTRKPDCDSFESPKTMVERYANLKWPGDPDMLSKLLRPKIYLDLELKGLHPLGRIVVQLYTEACPEIVLELVRVCKAHQKDKLKFVRMLPSLWVEGHLNMSGKKGLDPNRVKYDMSAADHGNSPGVLSFAAAHLARNLRLGVLSFTISFKPFSTSNGKRVAFGRVQRGQKLLDYLQKYGMSCGRTFAQIIISSMGVL